MSHGNTQAIIHEASHQTKRGFHGIPSPREASLRRGASPGRRVRRNPSHGWGTKKGPPKGGPVTQKF